MLLYFKVPNAHFQIVFISHNFEEDRIIKKMRKDGIETQIGYYALSEQNAFRKNKNVSVSRTLQNSLFLAKHTLALPLYYEMKVSEQNYVIKSLKKYI